MFVSTIAAVSSGMLYFYITYILLNRLASKDSTNNNWPRKRFLLYVFMAALLQFISLSTTLIYDDLIKLGLITSLSLITWLAVIALLITNLRQSTENLGIFIFPLAGLTALLNFKYVEVSGIPLELGIHILLSVGAYSIMGLAAAQAVLYAIQEKRFQQKKLNSLFKALPPLQVMECIMVQFITIGFVLLTLSLASGFYFLDDLFAQHLVHKTFFAIVAWFIYGTFLFGRYRLGWRGQAAAKFIIGAYLLLLLSYVGTEIVIMNLR